MANDSVQVDEDADIKVLVNKNRRQALDNVVGRYRDRILHRALYILKDYQDAVEVTREVFIKARQEPRLFDKEFRIKAWLFRVTSNLCFNVVRDRRQRANILDTMITDKEDDMTQDTVLPARLIFANGGEPAKLVAGSLVCYDQTPGVIQFFIPGKLMRRERVLFTYGNGLSDNKRVCKTLGDMMTIIQIIESLTGLCAERIENEGDQMRWELKAP